ncbi:MAG: transcription termination factor NusA [Rickettsiaceae bacterium]|nr:transcription termination factor NusA [Rickettsiaceae bacterium]
MLNKGSAEIILIAETVAREKGITMDVVLSSMEDAIASAGKRKYGFELNIKAEINQKTGEIRLFKAMEVVEQVENIITEISLKDAIERDPNSEIGSFVLELLPPIDLGRVAAQVAKNVIVQKVKDAEREKQYEDFKDRVGEIMSGIVKRVEFGEIVVDLGRTEAVIKKDQQIKTEVFKINDRIKAYVKEVSRTTKGPQIFLSRSDNNFLAKLMALETPEIYEGQIEIRAVARDSGSKAKVAVYASDTGIDPVGSCIGMKGSRIKAVTNELGGEKIDVILWSKDPAQYIVNAMSPAEISKVIIHEDRQAAEIIVPLEQFSIAIGRRGQNVRLASQLTGWHIEVMTEDQESTKRATEFTNTTELFMNNLEVEEVMAQLLAAEGYYSMEQIALADIATLESIEGFDKATAEELKSRAEQYINKKNTHLLEQLEYLGVEQELLDTLSISLEQLIRLAESGIKTMEDLAELTPRDFREILPELKVDNSEIEFVLEIARSRVKE